jgi:hypothetical protein
MRRGLFRPCFFYLMGNLQRCGQKTVGVVKKGFLLRVAPNNIFRGCVKRFFTALRAELCFERHVILTISRSEIVKMTCLSI